jgi:hypothetical protein
MMGSYQLFEVTLTLNLQDIRIFKMEAEGSSTFQATWYHNTLDHTSNSCGPLLSGAKGKLLFTMKTQGVVLVTDYE